MREFLLRECALPAIALRARRFPSREAGMLGTDASRARRVASNQVEPLRAKLASAARCLDPINEETRQMIT